MAETPEKIREKIKELIKCKGITLKSISKAMGNNEAYMQQFFKKGSPLRLPEKERLVLAKILNVEETELTDIPIYNRNISMQKIINKIDTTEIPFYEIKACCGGGLENEEEEPIGKISIPTSFFDSAPKLNPNKIKIVKAIGNSMAPTIENNDWVWLDMTTILNNDIKNGIYLINENGMLKIKRIIVNPIEKTIKILSDNPNNRNEDIENISLDKLNESQSYFKIIAKIIAINKILE